MSKSESAKMALKVLAEINKKYGEGTVMDLSKEEITPVPTFPSGLPSFDFVLGRGIPKGRIMEIYGPESSGKTTLALHMLAKAQKDGGIVAYIDVENAFDPVYAEKLGVMMSDPKDPDRVVFILNQPSSGEQALDIVEKLCQSGLVSAIVIDSVAQLVPMAVAAKEIDGTANIGTTARLLSQTLPRLSNAASKSGTTLIFINQIRMKIGEMYGNPETTPGGMALKFAASIRLDVRGSKAEERDGKEGMVVKVRARKNKLAPPFRSTELFLVFGQGFDELGDLLETAVNLEIIEKAGGWYSYKGMKEQGLQNFIQKLKSEPKILEEILSEVRSVKL